MTGIATDNATTSLSKTYIIFQVFKYIIYASLCYNVYLFFIDDLAATLETYPDGIMLGDIVLAFPATIDTLSWVVLLFVFELETFIISDENISGLTKWTLNLLKSFCYIFISYSFFGYVTKLLVLLDISPFEIDNVCNLIGTGYTYIVTLDEYNPITESVCQIMNNSPLFQINGTEIISIEAVLIQSQNFAWVDIINAGNWLLIVIILEVDVYLQLKGKLTGRVRKFSQTIKPFLYGILFLAAIYWGVKGALIDTWDAILWLLAFFFIEMNIFTWHAETKEANAEE